MHNEIVHVTQYLGWLWREGVRSDDPGSVLVRPRHVNDRSPRPIQDVDIARAMGCADQPLRAWIALAAWCGLRCMEIAALAREDVIDAVDPPVLRIFGTGGKGRMVPLPAAVLAELRAAGMPRRGALFSRMDGQPWPPSSGRVSARIGRHLRAAGVGATAHELRHRFATELCQATGDPWLVATVMGHCSRETIKGYADQPARPAPMTSGSNTSAQLKKSRGSGNPPPLPPIADSPPR